MSYIPAETETSTKERWAGNNASSSEGSCVLAMVLNTTPVDVAESDCVAIWELEEGVVACGTQKSRRGWCNRSVRPSITRSSSCKCTSLHRARQFLNILISLSSKSDSVYKIMVYEVINFTLQYLSLSKIDKVKAGKALQTNPK